MVWRLGVTAVVCFGAAALGARLTQPSLEPWYAGLAKPSWTPPDAVFAPVWTALFALMAVAAARAWGRAGLRSPAMRLFAAQLGLNVGWSALFFGLQNPGAAMIEIVVLWAAIAATLAAFRRVDALAGWLLVPYLIWVSYAAALNLAIWRMNG